MADYEDTDYGYEEELDDEVETAKEPESKGGRDFSIAYAMLKEKKHDAEIVKNWADCVGYAKPLGFTNDRNARTMTIYSDCVIKLMGAPCESLKKILTEEFKVPYKVEIVEIRGGFINV